ncbi:LysR family transcriptional regulator, partial [Cellulosimicrobium cellulans]
METRQLEYFVAVAEELSFTRAAARVFAVQSSVSAGVRALEAELGARLFERTKRSVALTSQGEALLPRARAVLDAVDEARAAVAPGPHLVRGTVRLGVFP